MKKVTAIIPSFNEERNIEDAIRSVQWADEILVIDSFSTDQTAEKAKALGAIVIQHEYENSAAQKNRAIPMAQHEWVFILDADERVTPALQDEINGLLQNEPPHQAYWIYRSNDFMGKRIHFSGWQGDKVIRLFKRDVCKYENKRVHAEVVCEGSVGFLSNKLLHNTYLGMDHYITKLNRYAQWQAEDCFQKGIRPNLIKFTLKPSFRFVKHYIIQQGFRDGIPGFVIAILQTYAVFMRYVKLWLLRKGLK